MWVLLGLSILAATLSFERCWFWVRMNHPGRIGRVERLARMLRDGLLDEACRMIEGDTNIYGQFVRRLLSEPASQAAIVQAVEAQRSRLERFMPTLSTVITAAPMLGILGTVVGLMSALSVLGGDQPVTDPRQISPAIAQALLTTAAGLVVAIAVLFPYNAFRAQVDRTLGRIEALAAASEQGRRSGGTVGSGGGETGGKSL